MGQIRIIPVVVKNARHLLQADGGRHMVAIAAEVIMLAGGQQAWRQVHGYRLMIGVQIGIERMLLIMGAIDNLRHHQADRIELCGVEHTADQAERPDLQVAGPDACRSGQLGVSLDRSCVQRKHGTGTVTHHEAVPGITLQLRDHAVNVVHGCVDILQLLEEGHLRTQAVFNGKHDKAHLTEIDTEMPVEILAAGDQAAAVDVDNDRCRKLEGIGIEQIHHMGRIAIVCISDIPLLPDSFQNLFRDVTAGTEPFEVSALFMDDRFEYRVHRESFHISQVIAACRRMRRGGRSAG